MIYVNNFFLKYKNSGLHANRCRKNLFYLGFLIFACAAANLAMGTRNGEQDT